MKKLIIGFNFFCTILLVSSCLCSPYYAKFDSLYQVVQDHITFDTLCQMPKDFLIYKNALFGRLFSTTYIS